MKTIFILLALSLSIPYLSSSQVSKTVIATAGGLLSSLTVEEVNTVTNLTLTGTIDARDFKTMRDNMGVLAVVDLSAVAISPYNGTDGPEPSIVSYPENGLPTSAFNSKQGLISIVLPNSLTSVGDDVFSYCYGLTSISFPPLVTTIGAGNFWRCTAMTSVFIPASVTSIGVDAFQYQSGLITVDSENLNYSSLDGLLFDKGKTTLIQCPVSKIGSYSIPVTVTSIGIDAFYRCSGLTSVTIPSAVSVISSNAFRLCTGLTSIYLSRETPVDLGSSNNVFYTVNKATCRLYVPCGSVALYAAANQWKDFTNVWQTNCPLLANAGPDQTVYLGSTVTLDGTASTTDSEIMNYIWTAPDGIILSSPSAAKPTFIAPKVVVDTPFTFSLTINNGTANSTIDQVTVTVLKEKEVNISAGGLAASVTADELLKITGLKVTGTIDARDFKTLRDLMPTLFWVDLSDASVISYTGTEGTNGTGSISYPGFAIPAAALMNKSILRSIQMPVSIGSIGASAFSGCTGLTSVTITQSVTSIGENAFVNCNGLTTINLTGEDLINLNQVLYVFNGVNKYGCKLYVKCGLAGQYSKAAIWRDFVNILNTDCPENFPIANAGLDQTVTQGTIVTLDGTSSFDTGNKTLTYSWIAPEGISLSSTTSITPTFTAPEAGSETSYSFLLIVNNGTVSSAEDQVVIKVLNLKTVNVTAGNLSSILTPEETFMVKSLKVNGTIDARDFKFMRDQMPNLQSIDLSAATVVEYSGFEGTSNVTYYPGNEVPIYAFDEKKSLLSVLLPLTVASIAEGAFNYCSGLTSISFPASVINIGTGVFWKCTGLTSVFIPASATSIGPYALEYQSGMITVDSGNPNYSSLDGILFDKGKTTLIQCPTSKTGSYLIPATITSIGEDAFLYCTGLTSVSVPSSVTSIGNYAFYSCYNLASASLPSSVSAIGGNAYRNCIGLTSVSIPSSVSLIGTQAFSSCNSLTSIYSMRAIPVNLESSANVFLNVNKTACILYVPFGSSALYAASSQWKDFTHIVEMPGFALSATTADVAALLNSIATVNITANTGYSVSSDQLWLVVSPVTGSGNHTLTFTATANPVTSTRTAIVTVSASGVESKIITVTQAAGELSLKAQLTVYLEGVYAGSGLMNPRLRDLLLVPHAQPYNTAPWNYAGTESAASIPGDIVDWVLVEIRQATAPADATTGTIMTGWPKACLLKSNGSIVDPDGTSLPSIGNPAITGNLYVVIRHRNHIAIMSATGMIRIGDSYVYDFTDSVAKAYGGTSGYRQITAGVCGMVSGDANSNGDISVLDFTKWATDYGKTGIYLNSDINNDGQVSVLDFTKWATNFGETNITPVKSLDITGNEGQPLKYRCQVPGN